MKFTGKPSLMLSLQRRFREEEVLRNIAKRRGVMLRREPLSRPYPVSGGQRSFHHGKSTHEWTCSHNPCITTPHNSTQSLLRSSKSNTTCNPLLPPPPRQGDSITNRTSPATITQETCQHAERRWASKLVRGQETGELPSLKVNKPFC